MSLLQTSFTSPLNITILFCTYGKLGWNYLLPVPTDVLLWHGRVKQQVCIFKEGWDGGGAAALWLFVIPQNHLNPYQSPLVQGDSRCSVDIRSVEEWYVSDILMLWGLSTWQKVGRWAQSHCQVSHDGSRWQFQSGPQMALAVIYSASLFVIKDVKIKSKVSDLARSLTLKNWPQGTPRISISSWCTSWQKMKLMWIWASFIKWSIWNGY